MGTKDPSWGKRGVCALRRLEGWKRQCSWNAENKFLLLKAEFYFARGEFVQARDGYLAAIESAKDHRFVHEEALSCEVAGLFHAERTGRRGEAMNLFKRSYECYTKWGAKQKLRLMQS